MEIESVFLDSKWNILNELSHGSLSPTELAEKTKTSLANISTQIRLLEALDFIEKEKLNNIGKGEPRKIYSLKKEFSYLILGTKFYVGKKMFKLDNELMPLFLSLILNDKETNFILLKFFLNNEILKEAESVAFVGLKEELEILIISNEPEKFNYLNETNISRNNKNYKVKAHIYKKETIENGFNKKEEPFFSLIKKSFILLDKENFLTTIKKS